MKISAHGFTLIELLIVIAIIGILSAISIPVFSDFTTSQRLSQTAKQVKNDLRSAQNRAINGVEGKAWGILFASPDVYSYRIYTCSSLDTTQTPCVCSDQSFVTTKSLSTDFTIAPPGSLFIFDEVSGAVCDSSGAIAAGVPSSISISLSGSSRTVTVSAGGKIEER